MRTVLYRREGGKYLAIATAVFYVKDSDEWRQITKAEMDVLGIQLDKLVGEYPFPIATTLPKPGWGENGDYYGLLYPLGPDDGKWEGEVWGGS